MVLSIHLQSFVYSNLTPSAKIGSLRRINERELSFSLADRRPAIQGHTPPVTFGLHQVIDSVEENLKKKKKCDPLSSQSQVAGPSNALQVLPMLYSIAPYAEGCKVHWVALKHMQDKHP